MANLEARLDAIEQKIGARRQQRAPRVCIRYQGEDEETAIERYRQQWGVDPVLVMPDNGRDAAAA